MKTFLRSILLVLVMSSMFAACKKKDATEEIDIRTQYVGTYDPVQYSAQTYIGAVAGAPDQGRGTLTVEKGTGSTKQIFINISFPGYTEQLAADLTGSKFTVTNKQKEALTYLNKTVNADYTATGEFTSDNNIIITLVVQTTDTGVLIKKVGTFAGPKK